MFATTCSSTEKQEDKCLCRYEDDFGNSTYEDVNRPKIYHFLHDSKLNSITQTEILNYLRAI